jgi:hypothetical protein
MTAQSKINEMRADQRLRIRDAIMKGESVTHICSVEGVDEKTVDDERKHLRSLGSVLPKGRSPRKPYGLSDASATLRTRLGSVMNKLVQRQAMEPIEAATMSGIPQKLLKHTWESRWDWKLSEIERLARHEGMDFRRFLLTMLSPSATFASKEEIKEWNQLLSELTIGSSANGSTTTRP